MAAKSASVTPRRCASNSAVLMPMQAAASGSGVDPLRTRARSTSCDVEYMGGPYGASPTDNE